MSDCLSDRWRSCYPLCPTCNRVFCRTCTSAGHHWCALCSCCARPCSSETEDPRRLSRVKADHPLSMQRPDRVSEPKHSSTMHQGINICLLFPFGPYRPSCLIGPCFGPFLYYCSFHFPKSCLHRLHTGPRGTTEMVSSDVSLPDSQRRLFYYPSHVHPR